MYATLERIDTVGRNIRSYWFRPEKPLDFVAGEYTELYLPHGNSDDRGERRWFTISSSPAGPLFSITTKFADTGSSSFKRTLHDQEIGSRHHFAEPMGDFVLPKSKDIPVLFVVGGIGVTPVHSIVQSLLDTHEKRNIRILYGASHEDDLVFADTFRKYGAPFMPIVSRPSIAWSGEKGRIDAARILQTLGNDQNTFIYLSGPEELIETLYADLLKSGVASRRLVTDYFHGYRAA